MELGISVIIPLYNKRDYIQRSIRSVLNQTFSELECIVVDDGSTDDSLDIIGGIEDDRIKFIRKKNGGVSSARNLGIKASKFEYLAFLDADDYWAPSYLEEISELIGKYPNRCLYFSSYYRVENGGEKTVKSSPTLAKTNNSVVFNLFDYFKNYHNYELPFHTSCCVVDKKAILEVGDFDERISYYEDYDFFSRVSTQSEIVYINKPLSFYNCDVDAENRLTGKRPPIDKHWASQILFGFLSKSGNTNVIYFVNNMAVYLLWKYEGDRLYRDKVKIIRKLIDTNFLSKKSLVFFYFPKWLIQFFIYLKNRFNPYN